MTKTVYIHVGLHKTGTTSIQWAMTFARSELQQEGILYPKAAAPSFAPFGHHMLPWASTRRPGYIPVLRGHQALLDEESIELLWQDLRNEIEHSSAEGIILSSEEFDILNQEEISEIGNRLNGYDIVPVIFLRNTADLMESSYKTAVIHSSYNRTIEEFIQNQRSRTDYTQMMRDWLQISPSRRMIAFNYDDESIRKDALGTFLKIFDIDPSSLPSRSRERQNESFPGHVVELARFLRLKGVSEAKVQQWIGNMRNAPVGDTSKQISFISAATAAEMDQTYQLELDLMNADSQLKSMLHNEIQFTPRQREYRPVRHAVDAILAIGDCHSHR